MSLFGVPAAYSKGVESLSSRTASVRRSVMLVSHGLASVSPLYCAHTVMHLAIACDLSKQISS